MTHKGWHAIKQEIKQTDGRYNCWIIGGFQSRTKYNRENILRLPKWRLANVASTSVQRLYVASTLIRLYKSFAQRQCNVMTLSTLIRRCIKVIGPLDCLRKSENHLQHKRLLHRLFESRWQGMAWRLEGESITLASTDLRMIGPVICFW